MSSRQPDYVVFPGEFISEWLEENNETQSKLAQRMGVSAKHVSELINAKVAVTARIAQQLALVTGIPAARWLGWESLYQADKARIALEQEAAAAKDLAGSFPLSELRRHKYVTETMRNPGALVLELMQFFRVGTVDQLRQFCAAPNGYTYRTADSKVIWPARCSWLRLGELAANEIDLQIDYSRDDLRDVIDGLRQLVPTPPDHFGSALADRLAAVGVALVYIPELKGTRAYGATRFYKGRPLVQLSLRRRDDGQFWFTLFHELAHLLNHSIGDGVFVHDVDSNAESSAELEADAYARDLLIPPAAWSERGEMRSKADVRSFAQKIGVSPGVVLGRLQHEGEWDHTHGHELFLRLKVVEDD